jgi:hypothetical protein
MQGGFTEFFLKRYNEEITNYPSTVDLINAIKYLDEQAVGIGLNCWSEPIPILERIQKLIYKRSYRVLTKSTT